MVETEAAHETNIEINEAKKASLLSNVVGHLPSVKMPTMPNVTLPNLPLYLRKLPFHNSTATPESSSDDELHANHDPFANIPLNHRESTAFHALRDTWKSLSLAPSFPSLPAALPFVAKPEVLEPSPSQIKDLTGNVLILGGFRGSILRDAKTGKRLWLPLSVAANIRPAYLSIPLGDQDELRTEETIVPDKALMALLGIVDLGKSLKDKLKSLHAKGQINFINYGYDWRRNLDLSSNDLLKTLEKIKAETGEGTTILAHSMGGLVTLHALSQSTDPSVFKRILFVGTPFADCVNVLGPLRYGDNPLLAKHVGNPAAVFSMRSCFYLLPRSLNSFELEDGTPYPIDLSDTKSWFDYSLSPLCHKSQPQPAVPTTRTEHGVAELRKRDSLHEPANLVSDAIMAEYLDRTLARVQKFRRQLIEDYKPELAHLYPPLGILCSRSTPTVRACVVKVPQDIKDGDYSRLAYAAGDGIVLYKSATALPEPWTKHLRCIEESDRGHVSLLGDVKSVALALSKL